jgi:hypothetical protein
MTPFKNFLVLAAVLAIPGIASADPNDIVLSRLTYGFDADDLAGTPHGVEEEIDRNGDGTLDREDPNELGTACGTDTTFCGPHQWAFRQLVSQLGILFAPKLLAPPRTLGWSGFYLGFEGSLTGIDDDARYWTLATEGEISDTERFQGDPGPVMFVPTLRFRKGFPFGVELGTALSWLSGSEMLGLGLDVRVAPFEGFTKNIGLLPDLAVRGSVTRVTGGREIDLTVVGVDVALGKRFGVFGQIALAPYVGWQHLWIIGDTEVVDTTPTRDALAECAPAWSQQARCIAVDGSRAPDDRDDPDDGRVLCESGAPGYQWQEDYVCSPTGGDDYENNVVFDRETLEHERAFAGLQLVWEHLAVTAQFDLDLSLADGVTAGRQWSTSLGVGLDY